MIIFNLFAIPVVIVIWLICAGIFAILPESMATDQVEMLIAGTVSLIVGGVAEAGGIQGRLFFLPIWLLGLLMALWNGTMMILDRLAPSFGHETGWDLAMSMGWWWLALIPVGLVGLVFLFVMLDRWLWKSAPKELEDAMALVHDERRHPGGEFDLKMWGHLDSAVYSPLWNHAPEVCTHNRRVSQLLLGDLRDELTSVELWAVQRADDALAEGERAEKSTDIDEAIFGPLKAIIEARKEGERWDGPDSDE